MNRVEPVAHRTALDRLEAAIEALSEAGSFDAATLADELASIVDRRAVAERLRRQLRPGTVRRSRAILS